MKVWLPVIRTGTGTDTFSTKLCSALNKRNINCSITWFRNFYEFFPFLLRNSSPPPGTTIIHTNSWNGFAFARKNIPLVVTEHLNVHDHAYSPFKSGLQALYHRQFIKQYEKLSFRAASKITCVSEYTAHSTADSFSLDSIEVIPTWVDTDIFTNSGREATSNNKFTLLFVGNPSVRKGWDTVLSITKKLGPDYRLLLAGNADKLRGPIPDNVKPLGRIGNTEKLAEIYRSCDALLFPSRLEGLSQVVLEAMSSGLPVVAADSCSMPELIRHGHEGFLCGPDKVDEFVITIEALRKNPEQLREISKNAREKIVAYFAEEVVIPKYISMYESLG